MATLTNSLGDSVTVNLSGWGGDNIYGYVKNSTPQAVSGAEVTVRNTSNGEVGVETTGSLGRYDIDVNASSGDRIYIHVQWEDHNGRWHVISGDVTVRGRFLSVSAHRDMDDAEDDEFDAPIGASYFVGEEESAASGPAVVEHLIVAEEPTDEASTREVKILPDVVLPPSQELKVGRTYTITIKHTLRVENDGQKVIQDDMVMSLHFPGVLSKPYSWKMNVYVKRNKTKSFAYKTTVRNVKPKNAGEFTLTGRTEFYGSNQSKFVKMKVIS